MKMDSKVHGTLVRNKDGKEIPEDEFVVFRPSDNSFLPALRFYREQLERDGALVEQLEAVDALIARVEAWRAQHPERCKVADVAPGELST